MGDRIRVCLASFIYCSTKILARTIDNRRNTGLKKDRPPRYLASYVANVSARANGTIYKLRMIDDRLELSINVTARAKIHCCDNRRRDKRIRRKCIHDSEKITGKIPI